MVVVVVVAVAVAAAAAAVQVVVAALAAALAALVVCGGDGGDSGGGGGMMVIAHLFALLGNPHRLHISEILGVPRLLAQEGERGLDFDAAVMVVSGGVGRRSSVVVGRGAGS